MTHLKYAAGPALAGAIALFAVPARAGDIRVHKTAGGETYRSLAVKYFGDPFYARHLSALTRLPEPLAGNLSIIIPTLRRVTAEETQSIEDFADKHLQDRKRAEYLKRLNRRSSDRVKKGQRLLVSQSLQHVVAPKETYKTIANRYYRSDSARRLWLMRLYNKRTDWTLRPGEALRIPLDTRVFDERRVAARAAGRVVAQQRRPAAKKASEPRSDPPAASRQADGSEAGAGSDPARAPAASMAPRPGAPQSTPAPPRPSPRASRRSGPSAGAARAIGRARGRLREGSFEAALKAAAKGLARSPAPEQRVELLFIQATALIALDRKDDAEKVVEALLKLDPDYQLDERRTSPKVLRAFQSVADRLN